MCFKQVSRDLECIVDVSFADWTDRLKVYNEYIKALADYKLKAAQAEVQIAQAANIWATVRAKQIVMRQIERDLRAYNRARAQITNEIKRVRKKDKSAQLLLRGNSIQSVSFTRAWLGYVFFESRTLLESGDALYDIQVPSTSRRASNFICIGSAAGPIDAPDEIENVLQLMQWLKDQRYITAGGSRAQQVVVRLFRAIASVAKKTTDELQSRMVKMRDGTYEPWNFNGILGVSTNSAAKKIQEAGT